MAAITTFLLLLAAVPASDASSPHKGIPMCPPAGAHVLLADAQAAIYTIHESRIERIEGRRKVALIIATRGCDASSSRSFRLDWEYAEAGSAEHGSPIPPNLTLDGSFVAYEESFHEGNRYSEGRDEELVVEWHVIVRDLRTGQILHRTPTGAKNHPKFVGDGPTTAIVVKADGAVAWITDTVQSENRYQVHALDKTGERTLAVGSNIDPSSLALSVGKAKRRTIEGSTLYWTQGGVSASALLN